MFDCVYATRTARFGTALTDQGNIKLKAAEFKFDFTPIDKNCDCEVISIGMHKVHKGLFKLDHRKGRGGGASAYQAQHPLPSEINGKGSSGDH